MNKTILSLLGGVVIGAVLSFIFVRRKAEEEAAEKIEMEVESLRKLYDERLTERVPISSELVKNDIHEFAKIVEESGEDSVEKPSDPIFIIAYEEFGTIPEFDQETLYVYDDDIIVDERDYVIPDNDRPKCFGDLDPLDIFTDQIGTIYIRNMLLKTDYELVHEEREYADDHIR